MVRLIHRWLYYFALKSILAHWRPMWLNSVWSLMNKEGVDWRQCDSIIIIELIHSHWLHILYIFNHRNTGQNDSVSCVCLLEWLLLLFSIDGIDVKIYHAMNVLYLFQNLFYVTCFSVQPFFFIYYQKIFWKKY